MPEKFDGTEHEQAIDILIGDGHATNLKTTTIILENTITMSRRAASSSRPNLTTLLIRPLHFPIVIPNLASWQLVNPSVELLALAPVDLPWFVNRFPANSATPG